MEIVIPVKYIDWKTAEPATSHTVCVLSTVRNESYIGIVGWYSETDNGITTVMVRFGTRGGLPRAVIDKYLNTHPSSLHGVVPSMDSWEADDIAKWSTLLQSRANEDAFLAVAAVHLRRYDQGAFGLMELPGKQLKPAVLSARVEAAQKEESEP